MSLQTYTAIELLELRGSQYSQALLDKVEASPDLKDIIKHNDDSQPRRLKKARDEAISSTDSEEHVVFQGKRQTRLPINNLDGEAQWKYRGRNGFERNSNEPIAAPTGLAAQQSEGFQRFFKAVVSPTHVRVTAGGRIVPNTRNTTSPTAKWDKDRTGNESDFGDMDNRASSEIFAGQNSKAQEPVSTIPPTMLPQITHPIYAGFPPMFAPVGAPVPFFPITNGMPVPYGLPQAHPVLTNMTRNAATQNEKQTEDNSDTAKNKSEQGEDKKPRPAPIKISPPEHFDQTRPCFFNGNMFYPGGTTLPLTGQTTPMTPSPYYGGFPIHPAVAGVGSYGQPSPLLTLPSPLGLVSPTFTPPLTAGALNSSHQLPQATPKPDAAPRAVASKTPVTSIKPSQITQCQLSSLRSQLKYYEDQMQYNKHQIDEKATHDQIQTIRKLIAEFEHNYQMQVKFEKTMYPNTEKRIFTIDSAATHCKTPSTPGVKESIPDGNSQIGSIRSIRRAYPKLNHIHSMDHIRHKTVKDLRQRAGINSSKGMDTTPALSALEAQLNKQKLQNHSKKFTLPTRAAMAPIFEPRSNAPSMPLQEHGDLSSTINANHSSDIPWEDSNENPLDPQGLWANMDSAGQFFASDGLAAPEDGASSSRVPYLVGYLPQGLHAATAHASDYNYSRELTEEEKRARHVYWGGVPVKGSGLPKFDGKDFYPASPTKPTDKTDITSLLPAHQVHVGHPEINYTSANNKSAEDPFSISHDPETIRSTKTTRKLSHAVPIINPETMTSEGIKVTPKVSNSLTPQVTTDTEDEPKSFGEKTQLSSTRTPASSANEKLLSPVNRCALNQSSKGPSNDLWQNMMKKGPTSGAAAPSSVSSTTANGYVPQIVGQAAASLSPAITNVNGSPRAQTDGKRDADFVNQQPHAEKTGENRPPSDMISTQADVIADLHQRMLRDAERRGVIGSDWQK